jgi:Tfp pilus assembly protein PilF
LEESVPYELLTLWDEARKHIEQHQFERAIEIYKYIILMYPQEIAAREYANAYLADVYLTLREPDRAKEHIRKALKINSQKPEYHNILGYIYSLENQWKRSVREFEIALQSMPEKAEYLRGLGWSTYNIGEREQGIWILNKALRIQPDDINILTDLAVCYLGLTEFQKARKYVKMALKVDPDNSQAKGTLWMVDYAEHQAHMEEE